MKINWTRIEETMFGIWVHDQDDLTQNRPSRDKLYSFEKLDELTEVNLDDNSIPLTISNEEKEVDDFANKIGTQLDFIQDAIVLEKDVINLQISVYDLQAMDWKLDNYFFGRCCFVFKYFRYSI